MNRENLQAWLQKRTSPNRHRQIVILEGRDDFCRLHLHSLTGFYGHANSLYLGDSAPHNLTNAWPQSQYRHILGREAKLVIINLNDGLRPNAILAAAGCVQNNGLLVLICKDVKQLPQIANQHHHLKSYGEPQTESYFARRLTCQLTHDKTIAWLNLASKTLAIPTAVNNRIKPPTPFITLEQQRLFNLITQQPTSTLHLVNADRGRGKSGLLGLLAGFWLMKGMNIAIVCPHQDSTQSLYSVIKRYYTQLLWQDDTIAKYQTSRIKWFALDDANLWTTPHDVLIVDEAASIAITSLKALCKVANKTLFSTTSKGYEGTGRTYTTRFLPWLKATYNNVQQHELQQPARWLDNDPVEAFWHRCCYLDLPPPSTLHSNANPPSIESLVTQCKPLKSYSDGIIKQIISLLMYAHYQTSADDIMRILDSPNTQCLSAWYQNELVGICVIEEEGTKVLADVADAVCTGQRRVKGHLSAQSLSLVLANPTLATQTYWRVQRIAVEEGYRNHGVGSLLLEILTTKAKSEHIDGITTSFGLTDLLWTFWTKNQFQAVRYGANKDKSSGEVSILMIKPLTPALSANTAPLKQLTTLELHIHPDLYNSSLVANDDCLTLTHDTIDCICNIIKQVASEMRQPQHAKAALSAWLNNTNNTKTLSLAEISLIKAYISPNPVEKDLLREFTITGRKSFSKTIQKLVAKAFFNQYK